MQIKCKDSVVSQAILMRPIYDNTSYCVISEHKSILLTSVYRTLGESLFLLGELFDWRKHSNVEVASY